MPNFVTKKIESKSGYGKYEIAPLPYGYGHSIGNALRRVLLSSVGGYAPTYVRINDITQPFSTISGSKESVMEIILAIRQLRFSAQSDGPFTLEITKSGTGFVTGADFKGSNIEVINKKLHIAEITKSSAKISIYVVVEKGTGYSPSEDKERGEVGLIPLDSAFSPVTKCNFRVEGARVGRVSNFDKLILEIWTDETINPVDALKRSSDILADFYSHLLSGRDEKKEVHEDDVKNQTKIDDKVYDTIIDELDLPTRVINALLRDGIETVGDLVGRGRESLVDLKGVGRKSIDLIDNELAKLGVEFIEDES